MRSLVRLAALAMTLVWCGAAQATVTVDGGGSTVTVVGDTADNDVVIGTANTDGTEVRVYISTTTPVQSGGVDEPCGQFNGTFVSCFLDSSLSQATVNLGDGSDLVQRGLGGFGPIGSDQDSFQFNTDLGDGNDFMTVMYNAGGTSSNGGNGYDRLVYSDCSDCQAGVTVNLAGGASGLNFEEVDASPGDDTLTGTARTTLPDDGEGEEREEIAGGNGDDVIDDGGGRDLVEGDDGNDTIDSLDQVVDTVSCGLGNDIVQADPEDGLFNCETTPGPPVAIGSGPSGTTSARTAHFEFTTTDPSPPAGQFQCQIDGQPDFTTCTSPVDLANLSDGAHTFRVRYDPTGTDPPGPVTERTWTVDSTAPSVVFDSAPSGDENGSTAQFTFHASESGAVAFECQLDGGTFFACASPHSLFGLSDGAHTFSVRATDAAGNTGTAASRSWTVSPLEGSVDTGCTSEGLSAGFGAIRLVARTAEACFVTEQVDGQPAKVSRGQVTLNGITLTPSAGTRIIVAQGLGDGTVRSDGPVNVAFGPPPRPANDPFDVTLPRLELPGLGTSASVVNKLLNLAESTPLSVAGMKAAPGIALEFAPDNGGQVKVTFRLGLPEVAFRKLPGSPEGVTVEFSPTFSNDRGVTFGGRIKLGSGYLFGRKLKDLDLAYDHGAGVFDGSLGLVLGPERLGVEPVITGSMTLGVPQLAGGLNCGFRKFGLVASNLQRLVGPGVFLQRVGGTFECLADGGDLSVKLTAIGGVSLGPRIAIGSFETEAVSIDGTNSLTLPLTQSAPFTLEATGVGKVVDFPVSSQTATYTSPATIKLTGGLDMTIGGYGAQLTYGEQGTFIAPNGFNIEAAGNANVFGFQFGAQAVFSSTGFAVCIGEDGDRFGFGRRWVGGELTAFVVCDVGPFRTAAPSSVAQAGRRSFTVGDGRPLTVVAAQGRGAPPKVTVSGPGGVRFETPADGGGISNKRVLLVQDPDRDTTFVVLFKPPAGRWSVSGSDLSRLRVARGLPPLELAARVSRRGSRRTLTWRARGLAGQRLQFVERDRGAAHVLTATNRASGRLRFRPDPALGRRRTIEAVVLNRGIPRSSRTVARFRFSIPSRPGRIRGLALEKRTLSWRAQPGIASYELVVVRPNGTSTNHSARRARLKLAGVPRAGTLHVSIVAVNALGRSGPIKNARFKL